MRRLTEACDRGATVVTFALMMTVLLAAVGLGVDGSALYAKRQQVQNGADAAAFAIAQEYAVAGCVEDYDLASSYARRNVPTETESVRADVVECGPNWVRVGASGEQQPFFMSVLGVEDIRVAADATVEWGVPVAGSAFPLAFSECVFDSVDARAGDLISVWVPNTNQGNGNGNGNGNGKGNGKGNGNDPANPCAGRSYPLGDSGGS